MVPNCTTNPATRKFKVRDCFKSTWASASAGDAHCARYAKSLSRDSDLPKCLKHPVGARPILRFQSNVYSIWGGILFETLPGSAALHPLLRPGDAWRSLYANVHYFGNRVLEFESAVDKCAADRLSIWFADTLSTRHAVPLRSNLIGHYRNDLACLILPY